MRDTLAIFLKSFILNYSNEILIYIGFTHVRILPGQAAVFCFILSEKESI